MQCSHCQNLFFKTLEIRVSKASEILYKKRCKRCKYKHLVRKDALNHSFNVITFSEWHAAQKISMGGYRAQIFVSEYTRKISQAAERQTVYLNKIRHAEEKNNDATKTAG